MNYSTSNFSNLTKRYQKPFFNIRLGLGNHLNVRNFEKEKKKEKRPLKSSWMRLKIVLSYTPQAKYIRD